MEVDGSDFGILVTAALSNGRLVIDGWLPAILGRVVMAIVSMVLQAILRLDDRAG